MGYFTVPFPLMIATAVAVVCATTIAARTTDAVAGGGDAERQLLEELERRIDGIRGR